MVLNVPREYDSSGLTTLEFQLVFFWLSASGLAVEFQGLGDMYNLNIPSRRNMRAL